MANFNNFKPHFHLFRNLFKKAAILQKFIVVFIFLFPTYITSSLEIAKFIIWNVGQGQWTTLILNNQCLHFDVGGEFFPKLSIYKECHKRSNLIFLSHGDWDHINGLVHFKKNHLNHCLVNLPQERLTPQKIQFLKRVKLCSSSFPQFIKAFSVQEYCKGRSNNCYSWIYEWNNKILILGDSPLSMEKYWLPQMSSKNEILILGHHGSHNSTSKKLLKNLPHVSVAVSSARAKKYGHPAKRVIKDLKELKIPLLRTEEWGNLIIEL